METIATALEHSFNILTTIEVTDIIDIVIVAYLIFKVISLVRKTNSYNLAKGLVILIIVLLLSYVFKLKMIYYLMRKTVELGLIAIVILFQPELRRVLERMGSNFSSGRYDELPQMDSAIMQTVLACSDMSASKTGALIIFERNVKLNEIMSTGTIVNADTTAELLKNLFYNKAPLHDGAVVIREGRIAAAGCVLPLTQKKNLSKELGMRHRAGIGLSEQSDAVVVVVSEETGSVSIAIEGMLKRHLTAATFEKLLRAELISVDEESEKGLLAGLRKLFRVKKNEEEKLDEKNI